MTEREASQGRRRSAVNACIQALSTGIRIPVLLSPGSRSLLLNHQRQLLQALSCSLPIPSHCLQCFPKSISRAFVCMCTLPFPFTSNSLSPVPCERGRCTLPFHRSSLSPSRQIPFPWSLPPLGVLLWCRLRALHDLKFAACQLNVISEPAHHLSAWDSVKR